MKAVQVTGPGRLRIADVPEPVVGSDVLVGIRQVGICGTDVKILSGGIPVDYPRIMGHEMVGEVVESPGGFGPAGGSASGPGSGSGSRSDGSGGGSGPGGSGTGGVPVGARGDGPANPDDSPRPGSGGGGHPVGGRGDGSEVPDGGLRPGSGGTGPGGSGPGGSDYGLAVGRRVLVDPAIACGCCDLCRRGRMNLCLNGGLLGRDADGTFAEYLTAPPERVLPVPEAVSDAAAGLLQVAGTCVHAQRAAPVRVGDTAVVIGLGVSGLILTQLLQAAGATVIGVTRSAHKRELACRLGAAATAAPADAPALIAEMTGGLGADLTVEAVGTEATLAQAIEWARIGGEVLVFGTVTTGASGLPYYQMYFKELTLRNPRAAIGDDYARAIELAATGVLDLEPLVTDTFTLPEAEAAFTRVQDPTSLKVLMTVA